MLLGFFFHKMVKIHHNLKQFVRNKKLWGRFKGFRFKLLNEMNDVHPTLMPLYNPPYFGEPNFFIYKTISMNIKSFTIKKT